MIRKYKELCKKLKINYSSDATLCIGIFILVTILTIILAILVSYKTIIIGVIIYLLFIYFHISNLNRKYTVLTLKKEKAFKELFISIINNLKNKNSFIESINKSLNLCDEVLIDDINNFLLELENDQSLDVFIRLSDNFNDENVKLMILYLSKFYELCDYEYALFNIEQFCLTLKDNTDEELIIQNTNKINNYRFIPIILSSLSVIIIFAYVFSSIGDFVSG